MSSDSACPWDLRFSRPRAGSGPQRHPVQTPLSRGQQAMEEQPPDPAGSPNPRSGEPASRSGHCTPPQFPCTRSHVCSISHCHECHMGWDLLHPYS